MGIEKLKRRHRRQWKFNIVFARDSGKLNLASDNSLPVARQIEGCAKFYKGERILGTQDEDGHDSEVER